ncbi:MAG: sulfatase-like hydrolase/transferase [Planctomycetota bacterium]|nr:sulfatase-like hydrolase/transferase [Planctomycetota bacterium]MDP6764096.1 sulfatase-like hydrolase/transferase [Planctomycetota bacterium]MDP6989509.1 sulfatase-like hydrolase/transferase [Planctomycetota bacterium]
MIGSIASIALLGPAAAAPAVAPTERGDPRPPNVLLILSDDQGAADLGAWGAEDVKTPHLDRLAAEGVRFTQLYAGAPVCSPSRASLLTGRVPQRCGVPGNVARGAAGLPAEETTLAEVLAGAGYATGLVGKWHLGHGGGRGPLDQGFGTFFGHKGGCIDNYSHFFYWSGPNVHDLWRDEREVFEEGVHFGDLVVREARAFLAEHAERPFFLFLPFNSPHYPLQGKPAWRERYAQMPSPRRHYAALLSTLDEQVGEILAALDELGLSEDTLVVFLSDHGHSTEVRALSGGGFAGPYRGAKFSLLEGGIRVPAIARLPGVVPAGEERGQLCAAVDWLPTIAELCGAELGGGRLDGRSLGAVLRSADAPAPHDVLHWQLGDQWAVREGPWKLVVNGRDTDGSRLEGAWRTLLTDLSADVSETVNLARTHPERVERLTQLHARWTKTWDEER